MEAEKDWKLKLRYGKLKTLYQHYTVIVPVVINAYIEDFDAQPGTAYAGIKIWAKDTEEASEIVSSIGNQTGFIITGEIELYKTDPVQAPQDNAYAYDINFSYYTSK
jgi:hypothetical protein